MNFSKRRQPAVGGAKNKSKQFSVALNTFYSTHRRLDWHPYSFGHPNVDFSAAPIYFVAPNATFGGVEYFASSQRRQYSAAPIISWRQTPPSAALNIFPAAHVAFVCAIIPKRRRVNYKVNHGFSHLASLKKTRSGVKDAMGKCTINFLKKDRTKAKFFTM